MKEKVINNNNNESLGCLDMNFKHESDNDSDNDSDNEANNHNANNIYQKNLI